MDESTSGRTGIVGAMQWPNDVTDACQGHPERQSSLISERICGQRGGG